MTRSTNPPINLFEQVLARSRQLYSLPRVAVDVLQLTQDPDLDTDALSRCIERDPALTAKILRVVNSSLYGYTGDVGSLDEAVTLLGVMPLKMLVLGFSLPGELFVQLAGEQLQRYWATALTRAVSARMLAEQHFGAQPDEAFLAALIDDIGMLALLGQLGEKYARFLANAWDEPVDVRVLERDALGFDHGQVTVALLAQWNLPATLVHAVQASHRSEEIDESVIDQAQLVQVLQLARRTALLVGRHQLHVLPDLLSEGKAYCGLTKPALTELVALIEPQVAAVAEGLQVPLPEQLQYAQIIDQAHQRLSDISEQASGICARLESISLSEPIDSDETTGDPQDDLAPEVAVSTAAIHDALQQAVAKCRTSRDELSLILVDLAEVVGDAHAARVVGTACNHWGLDEARLLPVAENQAAILLPHCERRRAVELARQLVSITASSTSEPGERAVTCSAGVASVETPPRNFDPLRLLESAQRCLFAAQASGGIVKSIEIY